MPERFISGDNHIDLTYCPPDLWSSQAPSKWKLLVPRVEELEDGLHWFVDAQDKGMWNGVGPGFLKYQRGMFGHIDEMKTYQQDKFMEPIIPLVGEDNIIWGADYPHPDCIWPESRRTIEKNLHMLSERVRRKITSGNVVRLYNLR
jgi:hypothetical protein